MRPAASSAQGNACHDRLTMSMSNESHLQMQSIRVQVKTGLGSVCCTVVSGNDRSRYSRLKFCVLSDNRRCSPKIEEL